MFRNFTVDNAISISSNANGTAACVERYKRGFAVQCVFAGSSPVGTVKMQGSCDNSSPTNWDDITGASASISGTGSTTFNMPDIHVRWIRLVWTSTSGTGTMTSTLNCNNPLQ